MCQEFKWVVHWAMSGVLNLETLKYSTIVSCMVVGT